jgi:hypothetical protein
MENHQYLLGNVQMSQRHSISTCNSVYTKPHINTPLRVIKGFRFFIKFYCRGWKIKRIIILYHNLCHTDHNKYSKYGANKCVTKYCLVRKPYYTTTKMHVAHFRLALFSITDTKHLQKKRKKHVHYTTKYSQHPVHSAPVSCFSLHATPATY